MTNWEKKMALTVHELMFFLEKQSHLKGVSEFFCKGGFASYTKAEIDKVYEQVFGNIEGENHGS